MRGAHGGGKCLTPDGRLVVGHEETSGAKVRGMRMRSVPLGRRPARPTMEVGATTPDAFAKLIRQDIARTGKLIRDASISGE